MDENTQKRTVASVKLGCAGLDLRRMIAEPDTFTVGFRAGIVYFHICPSPQVTPFSVPQHDLKLHRRRKIHPEIHFSVHHRRPVDATSNFDEARLLGILLVPLVEPRNGGVPNRSGPIMIQENPKSEINVVVSNPLILVVIF